jgi:hypothetical protein
MTCFIRILVHYVTMIKPGQNHTQRKTAVYEVGQMAYDKCNVRTLENEFPRVIPELKLGSASHQV